MPERPKKHQPYPSQPGQAKRDYDRGKRATTPELARAKRIRSSKRWQSTREGYLRKHPLCANPLRLHGPAEGATDVHHIQGLVTHPELAFCRENLASLCELCHNAIEALVRRGRPTGHLFG